MTTTQSTSPRRISTTDTAKLIRRTLRDTFPGVRFSVHSSKYAGGSSISVQWTDGPTTGAVDRAVGAYEGADFDGMVDLKTHQRAWLCTTHGPRVAETYGHSYASNNGPVDSRCCHRAELVQFSADYVQTSRDYSPAARTMLEEMTARREGQDAYRADDHVHGEWMSSHFHQLARRTALVADPLTGDPVIVADPRHAPMVPAR